MSFYIETFNFANRNEVEQALIDLVDKPIENVEQLEGWLRQQSLLFNQIEEAITGHYIDFQCNSDSEKAKETFEYDQQHIEPLLKKYRSLLDKKFLSTDLKNELNQEYYQLFIKSKRNADELFREERYSRMTIAMTAIPMAI